MAETDADILFSFRPPQEPRQLTLNRLQPRVHAVLFGHVVSADITAPGTSGRSTCIQGRYQPRNGDESSCEALIPAAATSEAFHSTTSPPALQTKSIFCSTDCLNLVLENVGCSPFFVSELFSPFHSFFSSTSFTLTNVLALLLLLHVNDHLLFLFPQLMDSPIFAGMDAKPVVGQPVNFVSAVSLHK